jgi:mannonate dehydratase
MKNPYLPSYSDIHFRMEQTMRWFGPDDPVQLSDILQAGCTGIVTALHHIPIGSVWTSEEIDKRIREIEKGGLKWSVVESIPLHESIKTRGPGHEIFIQNYIQSIQNLAEKGIKIITYNFMPILDWTRTRLDHRLGDGSKALYFERSAFMAFDLFILERKSAQDEYSDLEKEKALRRFLSMGPEERQTLENTILAGLPGAEAHFNLDSFREALISYKNLGKNQLRENLVYFLKEIIPVCDALGVKMALHPDDPPYSLLGLPRIVSREEDFEYLANQVPSSNNGICFCTGSLGVDPGNELIRMIRRFKERIHFVHLRNTRRNEEGDFYEENHLEGDVDMYEVVKELVELMKERKIFLPMRPDHGHQMLDDLKKKIRPGYSGIGRLRGLAEIRGLELGILRNTVKNENIQGRKSNETPK